MAYSQYVINSTTMTSLASAVRNLRSNTNTYTPSQMIDNIYSRIYMISNNVSSRVVSYTNSKAVYIEVQAFYKCSSSIQSVFFDNCIVIGSSAFSACSKLTTVSFPKCKYLGTGAFFYCSALISVSFPECLVIFGGVFSGNSSSKGNGSMALTTISAPKVTEIGMSAFYYCRKLTAASFPECSYVSSNAFRTCQSLSTAFFPKCTRLYDEAFRNCNILTVTSFPVCSSVGMATFSYCVNLSTISLPKCTYIAASAFQNCSVLSSLYLNQVTSVTTLQNVNAFASTPLSAGGTGKIYVPSSLLASFKAATNWSTISARLVGM